MKNSTIGILDSALIMGTFTGGGGVNAQEIIPRLAEKFDLIYFPRTDVAHRLNEDKKNKIISNIEILEKLNIRVSESFKKLFKDFNDFSNESFRKFREELLDRYSKELEETSLLYENDFYVPLFPDLNFEGDIYRLLKIKKDTKFGITLRGFGDINSSNHWRILVNILRNEKLNFNSQLRGKYISMIVGPYKNRKLMTKIIKSGKLDFVGYVNSYLVGLFSLSGNNVRLFDLFPADASRFMANSNTKEKIDNQIVFFARLVPEKGIFEIPKIAKYLNDLGKNFMIKVVGKFAFESDRDIFFQLIRKLHVDDTVEYLGFLPEKELMSVVSSSKVYVYPTHSDAYAISILESLQLRVPVVTYGIPPLRNLYKNVCAVRFVEEYDYFGMAVAVSELLSADDDYINHLFDDRTTEFLKQHSSYDRVAEKIISMLEAELNSKT